jgi:hypothetical protein
MPGHAEPDHQHDERDERPTQTPEDDIRPAPPNRSVPMDADTPAQVEPPRE